MALGLDTAALCQASPPANGKAQPTTLNQAPCPENHKHCIVLSWNASIAGSKRSADVVAGYDVYRSTKANDPNPRRLNSKLVNGTTYTDLDVEPGQRYFYVVRAVSIAKVPSKNSNQAEALIQ